jgi:4-hydroxy-3-methylbut-2-en-1-yl diphosphate synthase IspG/GcpE
MYCEWAREMADADYGYVGSGVDKITLYRGKKLCNAIFRVKGGKRAD